MTQKPSNKHRYKHRYLGMTAKQFGVSLLMSLFVCSELIIGLAVVTAPPLMAEPATVSTVAPTREFTHQPPTQTETVTVTLTVSPAEIATLEGPPQDPTTEPTQDITTPIPPTSIWFPTATSRPTEPATRRPAPTRIPTTFYIPPPPPVSSGCCKHCTNSKPCGNSCISVSKTCNKVGGCACY